MSTIDLDDDARDRRRLDAIPVWGAGSIPPERDHVEVKDVRGFADVMRIFFRAWPYLLPMVLGYWRERAVVSWTGWKRFGATDWNYRYVPFLVTALLALGLLTGLVSYGENWQHDFLVYDALMMTLLVWALMFVRRRTFVLSAVALVIVGIVANLFAILAVAGWQDNVFCWPGQLRMSVHVADSVSLCRGGAADSPAPGLSPRVLLHHVLVGDAGGGGDGSLYRRPAEPIDPSGQAVDAVPGGLCRSQRPCRRCIGDLGGGAAPGTAVDLHGHGNHCRAADLSAYRSAAALLQRLDNAADQPGSALGPGRTLASAVAALSWRSSGRRFGVPHLSGLGTGHRHHRHVGQCGHPADPICHDHLLCYRTGPDPGPDGHHHSNICAVLGGVVFAAGQNAFAGGPGNQFGFDVPHSGGPRCCQSHQGLWP